MIAMYLDTRDAPVPLLAQEFARAGLPVRSAGIEQMDQNVRVDETRLNAHMEVPQPPRLSWIPASAGMTTPAPMQSFSRKRESILR